MYHETTIRIEMKNEAKANEAIEVITRYISDMDDHNINKLIHDLSVEENAVVAEGCPAFDEDTLYVIPELFKAIAQNDSTSDFKGTVYYENDYASFNCDVTFKEHGLSYFGTDTSSKAYAVDDLILELKFLFWREIKKFLPSKFFNWENIPPSIEIYSSDTI